MAHLTSMDRVMLEIMLKEGCTFGEIAVQLDKATTTVSREILKHRVKSDKVFYGRIPNSCIHRKECEKSYICSKHYPHCKKLFCRTCSRCNRVCPEYEEEICPSLSHPSYVCNGCKKERECTLNKFYYIAKIAYAKYREVLAEVRTGVNLTEEERLPLDSFFSPLLMNGQSIHHVFAHNPNEMVCSKKSMYRYVNGKLLAVRNIDLPRVVKMKPRRSKPVVCKIDQACRINRTYDDYERFLSLNPSAQVIEMDTVEGVKGGKVLLTMHFKGLCDFMLAYIRDHNTAQSVIDIFNDLYSATGPALFKRLFRCIVTDRGTEFSNPVALETAPDGTKRTSIFYCDPQASWQKPNVELNHEYIRRILPKGTSFNHLSQNDIDLMMNYINSYGREKLNDKSPVESLSSLFGQEVLDRLGVKQIPYNEIILHPKLLHK